MPFPEHYLLQYGGDFVSEPTEIWSNNIRFCVSGNESGSTLPAMSGAQQDAAAAGCLTVLTSHLTTTNGRYSSNVRLKYVKFNRIAETGQYNDPTATHAAYATPPGVLGTNTNSHPITSAYVVTWLTARARGAASRGRIFIPHPSVGTSTPSYRVSSTQCTETATEYKTLLNALNSAVTAAGGSGGITACVVSQVGTGRAEKITKAQCGDILDYMGSRRNNLIEARYASTAVT